MIVCAALRYPDSTIVLGPRHFDGVMRMQIIRLPVETTLTEDLERVKKPEQGFIDQHGNFYTREEAWVHASAHSQIRNPGNGWPAGKLFSEHLY